MPAALGGFAGGGARGFVGVLVSWGGVLLWLCLLRVLVGVGRALACPLRSAAWLPPRRSPASRSGAPLASMPPSSWRWAGRSGPRCLAGSGCSRLAGRAARASGAPRLARSCCGSPPRAARCPGGPAGGLRCRCGRGWPPAPGRACCRRRPWSSGPWPGPRRSGPSGPPGSPPPGASGWWSWALAAPLSVPRCGAALGPTGGCCKICTRKEPQ